ncbi:MAG: hypothetical protein HeimC3_07370 [Candidatus Heimdallarchaeota archaeon LC_3]|nr:MAG: hypothetical protein HeimC3_07370 [Candidatus Heimdallarchaeota archaeon LC_3]
MSRNRRKVKTKNKLHNNNYLESEKVKIVDQLDNLRSNVKKRQSKTESKKSFNNSYYILGGVLIAVVVVGFIAFSPLNSQGPTGTSPETATYSTTCIKSSDTVDIHFHSFLSIYSKGIRKTLPPNIGLSGTCHRPIHTHSGEAEGQLHIESSSKYNLPDATLGDFFLIWGEPLTESRVWDYTGVANITVNNVPYNDLFNKLELKDQQQIRIDITS